MFSLRTLRFAMTSTLVMLFVSGFSQHPQHVPGEILLKLSPGLSVGEWLHHSPEISHTGFNVKAGKKVSGPMNIYSIQFDENLIDEDIFLEMVRQNAYVEIAQFNHYVKLRSTIPNDPQYNQQWQYDNTGQSGGTPGADIDMDLAWDYTTGGLTTQGDTIVVCVIDDGISATHPDIAPNLWVNHAEIPNNGIDDDNNGFIDDVRGWDTGSSSDDVYDGGGHGTPVAGIVGAKGDNGVGVAGVNWDVKLMIVQGGTGVESEVLEAYSYPLVMRQKYNQTNGAEGAFVVATNASWGVDFGQASSAPLWCAFYDTLGVHGILNAGATANLGIDIDVQGDLPTACPSDYLISVTNMNHNDQKVNQAAWGLTHVDLGAFGQGTWTTNGFGGYSGFGGTSGATPHVAGAIALLYAAPCGSLVGLAKSDPGAAALLVKQAILDGVDPNASLNGITVTGGRLNVHNSMLDILQSCGPCPAPLILAETQLTDVQARLNWTPNDSALSTDLQWRMQGDTVWNLVTGQDSSYLLTGLMPCTTYEYQLTSFCPNDTSEFASTRSFKTDGCCENPSNFALDSLFDESAYLSWSSVLAAQSYQLRIREVGGNWSGLTTPDTSFAFLVLAPCTSYEVEISVICAADTVPFGGTLSFRTPACGNCIDLDYCEAPQLDTSEEWIDSVIVNTLINDSGNDGGYGDYTASMLTTDLTIGDTIDFHLVPGYAGFSYDEFFRIWIDYNQDGDFDDLDEEIYSSASTQSAISGEFVVPAHAMTGSTRMRVYMLFDALPDACNSPQNPFGEAEDYCINLLPAFVPCLAPTGLDTLSVSNTGLIVGWDTTDMAMEYRLRYRPLNDTSWTLMSTLADSLFLNNLDNCQTYEMQVMSVCMQGDSEFGTVDTFTTLCRTALESSFPAGTLKAYPNPFEDQLIVALSFTQNIGPVTIELFNPMGQKVYHQLLSQVPSANYQVEIATQDLPEGIYWVRISDQQARQTTTTVLKTK